jgi:hypothetical protein
MQLGIRTLKEALEEEKRCSAPAEMRVDEYYSVNK